MADVSRKSVVGQKDVLMFPTAALAEKCEAKAIVYAGNVRQWGLQLLQTVLTCKKGEEDIWHKCKVVDDEVKRLR